MFNTSIPGMSITVSGGSAEENSQLCTLLTAALRGNGFRNVQLDPIYDATSGMSFDTDVVSAMRSMNPDLFDTPLAVVGESEDDMRSNMAAMGFGGTPFAFHIEQPGSF